MDNDFSAMTDDETWEAIGLLLALITAVCVCVCVCASVNFTVVRGQGWGGETIKLFLLTFFHTAGIVRRGFAQFSSLSNAFIRVYLSEGVS